MGRFLATTGITDTWNLQDGLVLLGPWCEVGDKNKELLAGREYSSVPSPWREAVKIKEAEDYTVKLCERLLPLLSERLNLIHGLSYPTSYWRTIIGTWLAYFIQILYDRYRRIESALEAYPDLCIGVLSKEECELTLLGTYELYAVRANDDYYNFKLFSLVADYLSPEGVSIVDYRHKRDATHSGGIGWKRRAFVNVTRFIYRFFPKPKVVLSGMYVVSFLEMLLLKLKTGVGVIGLLEFYQDEEAPKVSRLNMAARKQLAIEDVSDRFERLLCHLIPDAMPTAYVENYEYYAADIKVADSIKVVGSATGWHNSEGFKFFAAKASLNGAKLIEFQHGGGFGQSLATLPEVEALKKDVFYSWGWTMQGDRKVVRPLPSPKLSKIKNTHNQRSNDIIFVGTATPKYNYRFQNSLAPEDMSTYFEDRSRFFKGLKDEVRTGVKYRPYMIDYGWRDIEKLKNIFPEVQMVEGGTLINLMQEAKLVVIDHPHTSFLEALTINVPSIFYWDHDIYLMRPEAEEYFKLLRRAGILYRDPESAAKKLNEVYKEPLVWWRDPEVQRARSLFCERFALADSNWMGLWSEELAVLAG